MIVPHDFLILLIRQSKVLEMVCEKLEVSIYDDTGSTIIEKINTLLTVYELHEKNYQEKVPAVHEGESTELVSSTNLQ